MPLSLAVEASQYPWDHSKRMPYGEFTRDALTAKVLLEVIKDTSFNVSALTTALIAEKGIAFSTMELVARIVDIVKVARARAGGGHADVLQPRQLRLLLCLG